MDDWTKLHVDIAKALKEYSDKTGKQVGQIDIDNVVTGIIDGQKVRNVYIVNCFNSGG